MGLKQQSTTDINTTKDEQKKENISVTAILNVFKCSYYWNECTPEQIKWTLEGFVGKIPLRDPPNMK